jgi:hypothetical protein
MVDARRQSINEFIANFLPGAFDPPSSSEEIDDVCSSSSGSFNNNNNNNNNLGHDGNNDNNNNGKRSQQELPEYFLSCGMTLPKRRRRRNTLAEDQLDAVISFDADWNAACFDARQSSSDTARSESCRRRRRSHRRTPTPFTSQLVQNGPFQRYVTNVHSSEYETRKIIETTKSYLEVLDPLKPRLPPPTLSLLHHQNVSRSSATNTTALTPGSLLFGVALNCAVVLSSQILTMTDALVISTKPRCLLEATAPHRVLHSNAALYTSLSQAKDTSCANTTSTSLDPVLARISQLFAIVGTDNTHRSLVTIYPVYSTRSDYDRFLTVTDPSDPELKHVAPQYYLIEISKEMDFHETMTMKTTSLFSLPVPRVQPTVTESSVQHYDKQHSSLVVATKVTPDDLPTLVVA